MAEYYNPVRKTITLEITKTSPEVELITALDKIMFMFISHHDTSKEEAARAVRWLHDAYAKDFKTKVG